MTVGSWDDRHPLPTGCCHHLTGRGTLMLTDMAGGLKTGTSPQADTGIQLIHIEGSSQSLHRNNKLVPLLSLTDCWLG